MRSRERFGHKQEQVLEDEKNKKNKNGELDHCVGIGELSTM